MAIRDVAEGEYEVAVMDPAAAMAAVENPAVGPLEEVRSKLLEALNQLI